MRNRSLSVLFASLLAAFMALPAGAAGSSLPVNSENMSFVANLKYPDAEYGSTSSILYGHNGTVRKRPDAQGGTDIETLVINGRDYAFAGTYRNGLQVVDITDPAAPALVTTYECKVQQGDVQAFERDGRFYVAYAVDNGYANTLSACYTDAGATRPDPGTIIIDVTDPAAPKSVSFIRVTRGTHNTTVHPSGQYLYNSNSEGSKGGIEVISLADITAPAIVKTVPLPGGEDSHDITFNADGTRAYTAALDHTAILDTTDPAAPSVLGLIEDPTIYLHHQADPVTVGDRTFVVINDELNGAGGNEYCPGGGLHVYDVTGDLEKAPKKVGAFFAPDVTAAQGSRGGLAATVTCTAHVFRIYPAQGLLTIAWFGAGVRVIDLNGLEGYSAGVLPQLGSLTPGMKEVGYFRFTEDSDAWAAKVHRFDEDGSAYLFANDQTRGLDVYRYNAAASQAAEQGEWLSPAQTIAHVKSLRARLTNTSVDRPICLLRGRTQP